MPAEYTPRYNLAKPSVNGAETENVWGFDVNLNFDKLDAAIIKPAELSEAIEDQIASLLRAGANISLAYNDSAGTLTITGLIGTEDIDDRVAALIKAGPYIAIDYNDAAGTLTINNLYGPIGTMETIFDTIKAGNNVAIAYDEPGNRITIHSLGPGGSTGPQNVFDTVHDARLAEIPAQLKTITLSGYNRPGDAGPAMPCRRAQGPVTAHEGWFRTADRYKADGFEDLTDGGYWEYIGNNGPLWIEWFGGSADYYIPDPANPAFVWLVNPTPTDNYPAIMAAMRFAHHFVGVYIPGKPEPSYFASGSTVQLGYGSYYCSQTLRLDRTMGLWGMGGYGNIYQTQLVWPENVAGLHLTSNDARNDFAGSQCSHIRDIAFKCIEMGDDITAHAIMLTAACEISHCSFHEFSGNGIDIAAQVEGFSNANCFYLDHIFMENIGGHGVHCIGGDANAGTGIAINITAAGLLNDGYGIHDSSFLGNTWVGCHTAYCGRPWDGGDTFYGGAYYAQGVNAPVVFIGCYSESGQGRSYAGPLTSFYGGIHAAGIDLQGGAYQFGSNWVGGLNVGGNNAAPGDRIFYNLRQYPNHVAAFGKISEDGLVVGGSHQFYWVGSGLWGLGYQNAPSLAYAITDDSDTYDTGRPGPKKCEANRFALPNGMFLGGAIGIAGRNFDVGPDIPVGGAFAQGERRWSNGPLPGSIEGWVCTQSGCSGGTWTSGQHYDGPAYLKNAGNWYLIPAYTGGDATVPPVHTSGTVTGADGIPWTYITNTDVEWETFGLVGALARVEAIEADRDAMRETIATLTSRLEALEAR